jgi:flagellar motility protein MotE (MotC chaperone)
MLEVGEIPTPASVQPVTIGMKERELDRLARELRLKIGVYNGKQRELEKQQKRIHVAEELLAQHAKELEALRMQLVAPLTRLREAKADLESTRVLVAKEEKANLKHTAAIYEKMDTAIGGEILTSMCKNSQEDDVVKILFYMSERAAAKLLAEIPDKDIAAELCQKLKKVQEEG